MPLTVNGLPFMLFAKGAQELNAVEKRAKILGSKRGLSVMPLVLQALADGPKTGAQLLVFVEARLGVGKSRSLGNALHTLRANGAIRSIRVKGVIGRSYLHEIAFARGQPE